MSPNDIEVLIHCYGTREPHPRLTAPAVRDALDRFMVADLIKIEGDSIYSTTEGGRLLVEMLCATPWPEHRWIDPRTDSQ